MSVSCLRLQHIKKYGDVDNYEYLGMDFSSVVPDPNAEARDEIVFPDVSKNWKLSIRKNKCEGTKKIQRQKVVRNAPCKSL